MTSESLQLSIYLVALAALMIAGSFIGAEYSSGSIANWLSFLPRRGWVSPASCITIVFSALVSAAATGLALTAALVMAQAYDLVQAQRRAGHARTRASSSPWPSPCSGSASA